MTISSTPSEISYLGDGVTVAFPIPFPFDTAADLKVIETDIATGTATVVTVGFSIGGGGGSTGTLTRGTALPSTSRITILDDLTVTQTHDYTDNDPFPAESHETALDRCVRISKRLAQQLKRALRTADGDPISDLTLGSVDTRKGKYLFFNAITGAIEYAANVVTTALSQSIIGQLLNPQTPAEASLFYVPVNYWYEEGNVKRYGALGNGIADDSAAIQRAINVCMVTGGEVIFPPGVYLIATQLIVTSACTLRSKGLGGPRVFANPLTVYGGAELVYSKAVSDPFDTGSFAIKIDTGSVGAEGFSRVRLRGLGISWQDKDAGGVYLEGGVDIGIEDCWLTGGVDNYNAATQTGLGIYAKDAIISHIERCTFFYLQFGIVGENYWNENAVRRCNFQNVRDTCMLVRGKTVGSIRGGITENNFINAKYGVQINGDTQALDVSDNTFEIISHGPIVVASTDYLDATVNGTPGNLRIIGNGIIACNGGVAGPAINLNPCGGAIIAGNVLKNPAGSTTALVNVNAASSNISVFGNDPAGLTLVGGDPTKCALIDAPLFRQVPRDSSEATKTGIWGANNSGSLWWNATKKTLRLWLESRAVNVLTGETITKADGATTPSVRGVTGLLCNDTAPTALTDLLDGYEGQLVTIYNQSANNLTITSGANFALDGSVNLVLSQNKTLTVHRLSGVWVKMGTRVP